MNSEIAVNGTEIYTSKVFQLADEYVNDVLKGNSHDFKKSMFTDMVFYIHDRLSPVSNDDIEGLNILFDVYVRLCARYSIRPTLGEFALLSGNSRSTFYDWLKGNYRLNDSRYMDSVKRWLSTCETFLEAALTNSDGSSANLIFTAKANFGWTETAPVSQYDKVPNKSVNMVDELPVFDEPLGID